jgi:hypothetical protein
MVYTVLTILTGLVMFSTVFNLHCLSTTRVYTDNQKKLLQSLLVLTRTQGLKEKSKKLPVHIYFNEGLRDHHGMTEKVYRVRKTTKENMIFRKSFFHIVK